MSRQAKQLFTAALVIAALGACATTGSWTHPSKTKDDFETDRMQCEKSAERNAYGTTVVNARAYEKCMEERGWLRK